MFLNKNVSDKDDYLDIAWGLLYKWGKHISTKINEKYKTKEMIDLGKKHLGLDKLQLEIVIADAFEYIEKVEKKFDLILVDLFYGHWFPVKALSLPFLVKCQSLLTEDGFMYINTPNLEAMAAQSPSEMNDIGANIIYKFKK